MTLLIILVLIILPFCVALTHGMNLVITGASSKTGKLVMKELFRNMESKNVQIDSIKCLTSDRCEESSILNSYLGENCLKSLEIIQFSEDSYTNKFDEKICQTLKNADTLILLHGWSEHSLSKLPITEQFFENTFSESFDLAKKHFESVKLENYDLTLNLLSEFSKRDNIIHETPIKNTYCKNLVKLSSLATGSSGINPLFIMFNTMYGPSAVYWHQQIDKFILNDKTLKYKIFRPGILVDNADTDNVIFTKNSIVPPAAMPRYLLAREIVNSIQTPIPESEIVHCGKISKRKVRALKKLRKQVNIIDTIVANYNID